MAFERNDIVNKTRRMGELGEELGPEAYFYILALDYSVLTPSYYLFAYGDEVALAVARYDVFVHYIDVGFALLNKMGLYCLSLVELSVYLYFYPFSFIH